MYYKNKSCFRCSGFGSYALLLTWSKRPRESRDDDQMINTRDRNLLRPVPLVKLRVTPYDAYMTFLSSFMLKAVNEVLWWSRCWRKLPAFRQKLHCGPWTKVVPHATPPHLVKINFNEAQKLTWKEIKCLYGLITIITSNHISEILKMQLESRSRNIHT